MYAAPHSPCSTSSKLTHLCFHSPLLLHLLSLPPPPPFSIIYPDTNFLHFITVPSSPTFRNSSIRGLYNLEIIKRYSKHFRCSQSNFKISAIHVKMKQIFKSLCRRTCRTVVLTGARAAVGGGPAAAAGPGGLKA